MLRIGFAVMEGRREESTGKERNETNMYHVVLLLHLIALSCSCGYYYPYFVLRFD